VLEVIPEQHFLAVELGASSFRLFGRRGLVIGPGSNSHPGYQMVPLLKQGFDHFLAGVVGIGNQDGFLRQDRCHLQKEPDQFIQQCAFVPIRPDQALMDPADQRNAKELAYGPAYEQSKRLKGVAHDKSGFAVAPDRTVGAFCPGQAPQPRMHDSYDHGDLTTPSRYHPNLWLSL